MTLKEFNQLDPFNEERFAMGDKVVVQYCGNIYEPQEQKYFKGHPDPVVLKIDGQYLSYGPKMAKRCLRMASKLRYKTEFAYTEESKTSLKWVVVDTHVDRTNQYAIMATFGNSAKAEELAEEYAQFLNDVVRVYEEKYSKEVRHLVYGGVCFDINTLKTYF